MVRDSINTKALPDDNFELAHPCQHENMGELTMFTTCHVYHIGFYSSSAGFKLDVYFVVLTCFFSHLVPVEGNLILFELT